MVGGVSRGAEVVMGGERERVLERNGLSLTLSVYNLTSHIIQGPFTFVSTSTNHIYTLPFPNPQPKK